MADTPFSTPHSRRSFLFGMGASGVLASLPDLPRALGAAAAEDANSGDGPTTSTMHISLRVNGQVHQIAVEPRAVLLDVLRDQLQLPGTKKGCDHGQCGACTVLVNGRRIDSCLTLAVMHDGAEITTIEGLEHDGELHPMQAAFLDCDAFQCGGCTSGQIMSAIGLLGEPVGTDDASIRDSMSGNICRCGAYQNILAAVKRVRANGGQRG